jgi:hypothetical protein
LQETFDKIEHISKEKRKIENPRIKNLEKRNILGDVFLVDLKNVNGHATSS